MKKQRKTVCWIIASFAIAMMSTMFIQQSSAQYQDDQDDPPGRVARLAYTQGSVSFQPAGESEWVEAVRNRPLTTGDRIWADRDSRAELQLGSAVIDLNSNTGFSFLNLGDRTVQIQLNSGALDVRVRELDRDDVFEIDTPNQAFSIYQPGRYRVEDSEDGSYTVVSIREGEGESTGNGQTYTLHAGQRATFEGTTSLNAQVENIGNPDDFDNWSYDRDRRYEDSPSARYVSPYVVGYDDLDDNGDWRPTSDYGNVWFPRVAEGWAPYRDGHWAWIDPWGWSWVDDEPWGYAPFHYGRWVSAGNRWGWVPGPREVRPVYAPALVVFVGGGNGYGGNGANVAWFPLGPREVYVPGYRVSRGYVDRVNTSNTVVNTTTITNIYNTTIVRNNATITSVTYANRNVAGALTAVPQRAFVSSQPVSRSVVAVNQREFASAPVSTRVAVAPTSNSVFGSRSTTAGRVAAPPAAVANRAVIAKAIAPPPPVPFAARQQALAAHPGEGLARQDMQRLRPANTSAARPEVKQAPPGKASTPTMNRSGNQPANRPGSVPAANGRPDARSPEPNHPANVQTPPDNRPAEPPARNERPAAQPDSRPEPNPQQESNRPQAVRPNNSPVTDRPPARNDRSPAAPPDNRPKPNQPQPVEPKTPTAPQRVPDRNDRSPAAPPDNRGEPNPLQPNNRPAMNRQEPVPTEPGEPSRHPQGSDRAPSAKPNVRPDPNRAPEPPQRNQADPRPTEPPQRQLTPAEKKQQEEDRKREAPPQKM